MPSFRLAEFRERIQNTLRGIAAGRLDCGDGVSIDLTDITLHHGGGRWWVAWPARPLIDRDGAALRDDRGRIRYSPPVVRPSDKVIAARVEAAIIAVIRQRHPAVFDEQHEAARA